MKMPEHIGDILKHSMISMIVTSSIAKLEKSGVGRTALEYVLSCLPMTPGFPPSLPNRAEVIEDKLVLGFEDGLELKIHLSVESNEPPEKH